MQLVKIDGRTVVDWGSFHRAISTALGLDSQYGQNIDALIDCLSDLDRPGGGMSKLHLHRGQVLTIQIEQAATLRRQSPEIFQSFVDACAFVNLRRIENNEPPVLALAWSNQDL